MAEGGGKPVNAVSKPSTRRFTVLAVDDTPDVLELITEVLGPHYDLKQANNAALAIRLAEADPQPDLVLLDVVMPGQNGYEVCRALKGNPRTADIPVIFLSGQSGNKEQMQGFAVGCADYIFKPLSPMLLRARVSVHVGLSDRRRALERAVADRTREVENTRDHLIRRLSRAAELHEGPAATNRVVRVSHYAGAIFRAMGAKPDKCAIVMKAAPLYDIGMLGVRSQVFNKADVLSREDWKEMHRHPEIGADIIGDHPDTILRCARLMALTHHERWDGKGYPKGLKGEAIPSVGRLMALVDAFESMTITRYYREKLGAAEAAARIRSGAGKHFDPAMVEAFEKVLPTLSKINEKYADGLGDILDLDFASP